MGLISLTWVFSYNLVKIHFVFIEILPFSCSVLLLVKAESDVTILQCQIAKTFKMVQCKNYCTTKLVQFH